MFPFSLKDFFSIISSYVWWWWILIVSAYLKVVVNAEKYFVLFIIPGYFFQHLKKYIPLSSSFYSFWWKVSVHAYYCSPMHDVMCLSPTLAISIMFSLCLVSSNLTWDMFVWFLLCLLCLESADLHGAMGFHQIWISFNYRIFKYFSALISLLFLGLHLHICSTTQYWPWLTEACSFFLPSPFLWFTEIFFCSFQFPTNHIQWIFHFG